MTAKGTIRGPNHFIDPDAIVPGTPTGVEVSRDTVGIVPRRWKNMVTIAQHTVDRLNRVGLPPQQYQMTVIRRHILKELGPGAFDDWHVEAKMFQQPDGSIQVWCRYTAKVAAA